MPRRNQQNDIDLGQILQLWNAFSPEAQARAQLVQQQVAQGPQLSQAQIDAIHAEAESRRASAGLSTAQAGQVVPESQASIAMHNAARDLSAAQTGQVVPRSQAEIAALGAGTAKTQADTATINAFRDAQLKDILSGTASRDITTGANVARLGAETGLSLANTGEVAADAASKRNLYASEVAKNLVGGVAPYTNDKNIAGGVIQGAISGLGSSVTDPIAAGTKATNDRLKYLIGLEMAKPNAKIEDVRKLYPTAPPEFFVPHEHKAGLENVGVNLDPTDPYFAQVNDLLTKQKEESKAKKVVELKTKLDLVTKALSPDPTTGRSLVPEAQRHYANQRALFLKELATLGQKP